MPSYGKHDFEDDNEDARNHELMLDGLLSDTEDFIRTDEDGWFYSTRNVMMRGPTRNTMTVDGAPAPNVTMKMSGPMTMKETTTVKKP